MSRAAESVIARNDAGRPQLILIACVAVFLLQQVTVVPDRVLFALWPLEWHSATPHFQLWQLVSYAFLHGGIRAHLLQHVRAVHVRAGHRAAGRVAALHRLLLRVRGLGAALAQLAVQHLVGNRPGADRRRIRRHLRPAAGLRPGLSASPAHAASFRPFRCRPGCSSRCTACWSCIWAYPAAKPAWRISRTWAAWWAASR